MADGRAGEAPVANDMTAHRSILRDIVIDYGPRDILGRLFLKADTGLRQRGVSLSFADFEELVAVNEANSDNWRPLLPCFNPKLGRITRENGFAVIGRNASGEAVTAHACRLYTLTNATLKDELESLRIFYDDPERSRGPDESITVTAPSAARTTGRVVFSGSVWYRPDFRKAGLMPFTTQIVRAISYTKWYSDLTFSFMVPELVQAGIAAKGHFKQVEWDVLLNKTPVYRPGLLRAALVSSTSEQQLEHFREFVEETGSETGESIRERRTA